MAKVRVASCLICCLCTHAYIISPISCAHSCILAVTSFVSNSLYFGVNEIISFQKLVRNLDKITVANLSRQHQRSLDSYFKSSHLYLFGVISYYFISSMLLRLVVYILKLIILIYLYSLNNTTTLCHLSY